MPTRNEIQQLIQGAASGAQDAVRRQFLADLSAYTNRPTIFYAAAYGLNKGVAPGMVSIGPADIQSFMTACHALKGSSLDLILHSPGGVAETAEQIVSYLRSKYQHIRAIVPQNAMSAATMLACACDEIVMGRQSALGPIDPQVMLPRKNLPELMLPAAAYLAEFEQAKTEIAADPKTAAVWLDRLRELPPGFLAACKTARVRAQEWTAEWLERYMKLPHDTAGKTAAWLANEDLHKSHGRPISAELAEANGLRIVRPESDQELQEKVLSVFHATMVTFEMTKCVKLVENNLGRGHYLLSH